jgi:ATP-dependent Lhr-like helicase
LRDLLRGVESGRVRVRVADTSRPSPFAASLLFTYVGNYMYEGDTPLAERRAAALALDHAQLRALLGEPDLRELLDESAILDEERRLQRLDGKRAIHHADALNDTLLSLGPLTRDELRERARDPDQVDAWVAELLAAGRLIEITFGDRAHVAAVEEAGRLRDALGVRLPPGLPAAFLESRADPVLELIARHARTHGPFRVDDVAQRLELGVAVVRQALLRLQAMDRVAEGEFVPRRSGIEWCDVGVLRRIKQRSLARLRKEVEPVEHDTYARFASDWHGVERPMRGLDGVLAAIERLQGLALPASDLEERVLPARVGDFSPRDLDELATAGEIVWRGAGSLGTQDGRIELYLADHYATLASSPTRLREDLHVRIREQLGAGGAVFFPDLERAIGAFQPDLIEALFDMVWNGEVTNDTLAPLRSRRRGSKRRQRLHGRRSFRTRRIAAPPGTEGRWSLLPDPSDTSITPTDRAAARARQLLDRHGIVCRETVRTEDVVGGFSAVYPVFRAMEEAGRVRRGYFVSGLGAAQFALPGADDRLRRHREAQEQPECVVLAATDPAQPYGAVLPWPPHPGESRPQRASGARCILRAGRLIGWLGRSSRSLLAFTEDGTGDAGDSLQTDAALADAIASLGATEGLTLVRIDGADATASPRRAALEARGFTAGARGLVRPPDRNL